MKHTLIILILFIGFVQVHAQDVAATQPTMMVIPADGLLDRMGHLHRVEVDGRMRTVQDYEQLFIDEPELRLAISQIQERFADKGFPLKDLEFSLKSINTETAFDEVENIDIDLKGIMLKSANPDVYLDLDYFWSGSGLQKKLNINIRAVDAYTLQAFGAASDNQGATLNNDLVDNLIQRVEENLENLQSLMQVHFKDIRANGRVISVRINIETGTAVQDFRRERCDGMPYTRAFQDYIKRNTVAGAHHVERQSAKEVKYDMIRIPLYDKEGYPMGASDWAYQFSEHLSNTCGQTVIDISSKLGEAHLLFIPN